MPPKVHYKKRDQQCFIVSSVYLKNCLRKLLCFCNLFTLKLTSYSNRDKKKFVIAFPCYSGVKFGESEFSLVPTYKHRQPNFKLEHS